MISPRRILRRPYSSTWAKRFLAIMLAVRNSVVTSANSTYYALVSSSGLLFMFPTAFTSSSSLRLFTIVCINSPSSFLSNPISIFTYLYSCYFSSVSLLSSPFGINLSLITRLYSSRNSGFPYATVRLFHQSNIARSFDISLSFTYILLSITILYSLVCCDHSPVFISGLVNHCTATHDMTCPDTVSTQ